MGQYQRLAACHLESRLRALLAAALQLKSQHFGVEVDRRVYIGCFELDIADAGHPSAGCDGSGRGIIWRIDRIMIAGGIGKENRSIGEAVRMLNRPVKRTAGFTQRGHDVVEPLACGREGIRRHAAPVARLGTLFALQVNAHAFAADLNEGMRHRAALALAHVQAVALGDYAAENADIKFFSNDHIVDRNDKVVQRFS